MRDTDHQSASAEPRWPVALAVLTMLGLVVTLPARLQVFPPWFPYAVVVPLLAPMVVVGVSHGLKQWIAAERVLVLTVAALIAVISVATLVVVIREMLSSSIAITGLQLLASSVALWVTFIVIASLLYWQLDRGGPGGGLASRPNPIGGSRATSKRRAPPRRGFLPIRTISSWRSQPRRPSAPPTACHSPRAPRC
jgi:hypothetical protein